MIDPDDPERRVRRSYWDAAADRRRSCPARSATSSPPSAGPTSASTPCSSPSRRQPARAAPPWHDPMRYVPATLIIRARKQGI